MRRPFFGADVLVFGEFAVNRSSFDRSGLGLMLATILVWSGAWIAMKLIVPYIGPYDFVVVRYLCGAWCCLPAWC